MKILLTGATGFIGRQLIKDLKERQLDFICLLRDTEQNRKFASDNNINAAYGSLEDTASLHFATKDIDIIIHLAALLRTNNWSQLKKVNVDGTNNLLLASNVNNFKRFIFISSYLADEKFTGNYAKSKREAEQLVKSSGIPYTILRPTLVYGKDDFYMTKIINMVKKYKAIPFPSFMLQPVHVKDVNQAIISSIEKEAAINKEYVIAGPYMFDVKHLVKIISNHASLNRRILPVPFFIAKPAAFLMEKLSPESLLSTAQLDDLKKVSYMDISLAKRELNFKPIRFEDGIKEML